MKGVHQEILLKILFYFKSTGTLNLDTHNLDHSSQEKMPRSSCSAMSSKLLLYLILEKHGTLTMTIT